MVSFLRLLVLSLLFGLALPAAASEKFGKDELDAQKELLQLKIDSSRELTQKDVDSLKSRIDALDKRQDDQNNRVGDIGQAVDRFAVITGIAGLVVTLLLALVGLIGYFSVTRQAKEEAESASRQWFDSNHEDLLAQIDELKKKAAQGHQAIEFSVNEVAQKRDAAMAHLQGEMKTPSKDSAPINRDEEAALRQSAEDIRAKPEASYSFDDWNTRAFDAFQAKQYEDAALYWKRASSIPNAGALNSAQALFNRAYALQQLGWHAEACTTYQQLIDTYSSDNTAAIREQVATGMLNMGVAFGQMQKPAEEIATYQQLIAKYSSDTTPAIGEQVASAMLNTGIALGEMQKPEEAISTFEKLIATYSSDKTPGILELVADTHNSKGFAALMEAKNTWQNREQAQSLLCDAQNDLLASLALRTDCGMTHGNLAYVQWLLGDTQAAEHSFRRALASPKNSGETLYHATLEDIEQHTIVEDEGFQAIIERLWAEHQAAKSSGK